MITSLLVILTLIKVLIALVGLAISCWHLLRGLLKKDEDGTNKALKYFFATVGAIMLISVIDFLIALKM